MNNIVLMLILLSGGKWSRSFKSLCSKA